ncbi:S-layer homology domain-containing protein [Rothia sp. P6271]|uniref:S-layer homology domain-containing protein n=1 Tax=Rothia sp. P6271 TaxID=3402659 RepID=UPI003AD60A35
MNLNKRNRFTTSALVGMSALSLLGSSFVVPAQAHEPARSISVDAQQTQGIPGQYQAAYSKTHNKMWVTGSFLRTNTVSTIARVNPETMKIEAVAELPAARSGTGVKAGFSYMGAFGIAVDDVNNTVWVTNTRTDSISVYDQDTMELLWTNYDVLASEPDIEHPRSVIIDNKHNKAYITGRYNVWSVDLTSHEIKNLAIKPESDVRVLTMNPTIDENAGLLYVPERSSGTVQLINLDTFTLAGEFTVHADDPDADVYPSGVAIDHSLREIYISSQGKDGKNSGVTVYDLDTHAFKKSIPFGTRALGIVNDEERDLVYVADFGQGSVGVIDAAAGKLVADVNTGEEKTNDLALANDGSVFAVDKGTYAEGVNVPFALDFATGKPAPGNKTMILGEDISIDANSFTRFTVDVKTDDAADASHAEKDTVTNSDGATVTGVKTAENGKDLVFSGTGWTTKDGVGSVLAAKFDMGGVSVLEPVTNPVNGKAIPNKTVYGVVQAGADGSWTATLPFPTPENSTATADEWAAGTEHSVTFLSGSLAQNDNGRSVTFDFTVGAPAAAMDSEAKVVEPTKVDFQGYPELTKTTDKDFTVVSFKDNNDSVIFHNEIQWVGEHGVAKGWSDGTYRPFENIDRGAMAAYMYRLAGSPRYHAPEESPFKDVPTDHVFYKEIAWLHQAGITTGWADGTYRPSEPIKRDAMAAFFYRAAGSPEFTEPAHSFKDVSNADIFHKEIAWMKENGISKGWEDNTYRPYENNKRDAMAAFVYRFAQNATFEASAKK